MSHPRAWALPVLHPSQEKVWAQGIMTPSEVLSLALAEDQHSHCYSMGGGQGNYGGIPNVVSSSP